MLRNKQALVDISTAIQQILKYTHDIDREQLQQDDEKQAAILYRLIIMEKQQSVYLTIFVRNFQQFPGDKWLG